MTWDALRPGTEDPDATLTEHGELLKPARNKLIARSDRENRVNPIGPRQLKDERAMQFLEDLLARFDAAGASPVPGRRTFGTLRDQATPRIL